MKEIPYDTFSLDAHRNAVPGQPLVFCQFELTFRCGLRCKHCYAACYNTPALARKELSYPKVKRILDALRRAGVLWLCLTGGDPLARNDFPRIYAYAKKQGFLITIFTSAERVSRETALLLEQNPPFLVEITLNAVDKAVYERMAQVQGSHRRVMMNIRRLKRAGIPVKIKTTVTRDTIREVPGIRAFAARQGFMSSASYDLYPRLNKDTSVCSLRLSPGQVVRLQKKYGAGIQCVDAGRRKRRPAEYVFSCPVGTGRSIYIDPYGRAFLCPLIRDTGVDLLRSGVRRALSALRPLFSGRRYRGGSECRTCGLSAHCPRCPGEAYLETGDVEAPIPYYCALTRKLVTVKNGAR
jgi:radical SAM protein with 4Fe4S-binding SPASM domain